MAEHSLKDKLRAVETGTALTLSEADLKSAQSQPAYEDIKGNVDVPVPAVANQDPLINAGAGIKEGKALDNIAADTAPLASNNLAEQDLDSLGIVTITEEDREAFLQALITGERYTRPFSLFGGKVTGIMRCRSAAESEAIAAWLSAGLRDKRYATTMDYSLELRNVLLTAQVARCMDTEFPAMAEPLMRTQSGATTQEPGWLAQSTYWASKPEAMLNALYEEVRIFERKYWTMIENASNQDFWHPVRST